MSRARRAGYASRGFTLIELLVVIGIVAILSAIAYPSLNTSLRNGRVTSQTNDLLTAFTIARNEAITRTRGVTVCAANTISGVPTTCGAATDWYKGWVVFVDDTAGAAAPPATLIAANILRVQVATQKTTITPNPATQAFYRFSARGTLAAPVNDSTLTIKPSDACIGKQKRVIDVQPFGRSTSSVQLCP